jgi:hypothetical protein
MKVVQEEPAEGWHTDPFGRHEARRPAGGRELTRGSAIGTVVL